MLPKTKQERIHLLNKINSKIALLSKMILNEKNDSQLKELREKRLELVEERTIIEKTKIK